MAWSIFTDGGGNSAAVTWARDLLTSIGAPLTPGNITFIYQWEQSEGSGGEYNPLNQGPVPGQPSLTTSGPQYGGGAANYASWDAGIQGATDYLEMPAYAGVLNSLKDNNPDAAKTALWDSTWASSHYGYGSLWSSADPPGYTGSALSGGSGSAVTSAAGMSDLIGLPSQVTGFFSDADTFINSLMWIVNPSSWLRIGAFLTGVILLLLAVTALVRVSSGESPLPDLSSVPVVIPA